MASSIREVLAELRASALSQADKGAKFERLMKAFLTTDPVYAEQFKDVWLWQEWPGRGGKPDTGIDLIAQDRLTEGYVAIQCKFYAPTTTISKDDIDTFLSESGKEGFVERIVVSTTDKWNGNAENAIKGQQIPVRRIGLSDLEASPIDWRQFSFETPEVLITVGRKSPRPHQISAIEAAVAGFASGQDRGKLIMACGTGKTFTALRLAEKVAGAGGSVLFLVPSISLLSQTLREWSVEAEVPLRPVAVCSDRKSTARSKNVSEDIATVDLALPATTNVALLAERWRHAAASTDAMTVVFSTYQSIEVVARAQAEDGIGAFDLIICDEAHRTTGYTLAEEDESPFVKIHDRDYIKGTRRIYMTATPRIYDDATRTKAGEANAVLADMSDETTYGPEFFRLGFGDAVARDLLTDYKVLVLAVDEESVARTFQVQLSDDGELKLDDATRIVGCWNGLAKRGQAEHDFQADPAPMRRAVAFAGTIAASRKIESMFEGLVEQYIENLDDADDGASGPVLDCEVRHVDGTFNALERNAQLDWLRADVPDGTCRILTNARCLSEGVDIPALDAVLFLSPRKSVVDVVQSVGRVMRKAPGKQYGYILLPVGIPAGVTPEVALRDNARYQVVWEVLQALRAHDDRFNAEVNKIDLTKKRSERINVIGIGGGGGERDGDPGTKGAQQAFAFDLANLEQWRDAVYARIVAKVGSRRYWETWAGDVAEIAEKHRTRITALLHDDKTGVAEQFEKFLDGLRGNLNDSITTADAIDMLAQHLITRPVFDALFADYDFAARNPVAQTMQAMLDALDEHSLDAENETLERFYESVRMRVAGIDTAEGKQKIITELYERFFKIAFPRVAEKLGIVYTPVEVVDFILRAVQHLLQTEFDGASLTDPGVHVLDPFTGTGTFIARLLTSGHIGPADLARKYASELHANEILLLAYYIAAINIEATYHGLTSEPYRPFDGIVLTDTFQIAEAGDVMDELIFPTNNARVAYQKALDIRVIIGNPPYAGAQDSQNDENQNLRYPTLDAKIAATYAARSTATNRNSLYNSYIRAIRWASDRLASSEQGGVIGIVSAGGYIDDNSADGLRKSLVEEFQSIYVYNLRGNQRTSGELSKREGGKVFGSGSRNTVAITLLVKRPGAPTAATVCYHDIGDNLTREQKLELVGAGALESLPWQQIRPNDQGDWLHQRSTAFDAYLPIADKDSAEATVFGTFSPGLQTNRDAWVYNYSSEAVETNTARTIAFYNTQVAEYGAASADGKSVNVDTFLNTDPTKISWQRGTKADLQRGKIYAHDPEAIRVGQYRPFCRQHVYFHPQLNAYPSRMPQVFPTPAHHNRCILVSQPSGRTPFSVLMTDLLPDTSFYVEVAHCFSRYTYERIQDATGQLFSSAEQEDGVPAGWRRVDNVTDTVLGRYRDAYGSEITKDDVFHYVYGLLHSPDYRSMFAANLKRMLPRIPQVATAEEFSEFVEAGQRLAELHVGYEAVEPYPLTEKWAGQQDDPGAYVVEKMRFAKNGKVVDRAALVVNSRLTLAGIPEETHGYQLGARSALDWVIDRYQVSTHAASGIRNDPNEWAREHDDPRYIIDLVKRVVAVSVETVGIVRGLPALRLNDQD